MKPNAFFHFSANKLLLALLVIFTLLSTSQVVSAEHEWDHRYVISGIVTSAEGEVATDKAVFLDCGPENANQNICGHNEGRNSTTDESGFYSIILHVHTGDHDEVIYLLVENKSYPHVIDLEGDNGQQEEGDRAATMNIDLSENPPKQGINTQIVFATSLFVIGIFLMLKLKQRTYNSAKQRSHRSSSRPDLLNCPKCETQLKQSNLVEHLIKRHYYNKPDAQKELETQTLP